MHNILKSHDDKGAPAMAGLLLCVMVSTPLLGCLIPQDDQVIPALPPKRNSALKIVSQEPQEPRTTFYNSTSCLGLNPVFVLIAEDEDVADIVYSMWFVDKSNASQPFRPNLIPGGGSQRRSVTAPSSGFKSALANLGAGTHLLTVYVADSAFQEVVDGQVSVSRPDKVLPDGGVVADKGSIDNFTWVLDVEPCP